MPGTYSSSIAASHTGKAYIHVGKPGVMPKSTNGFGKKCEHPTESFSFQVRNTCPYLEQDGLLCGLYCKCVRLYRLTQQPQVRQQDDVAQQQ